MNIGMNNYNNNDKYEGLSLAYFFKLSFFVSVEICQVYCLISFIKNQGQNY